MKLYCHTMTIIIDLTFKAKRKRNFYGQTTYIVKVETKNQKENKFEDPKDQTHALTKGWDFLGR